MKIIDKAVISLGLTISLLACSHRPQNAVVVATAAVETALVQVSTTFAETQAALVTSTPSPLPLPTFALPTFMATPSVVSSDGLVHPVPEARLDYAMATAPKVYNRLPYIGETGPYGGQYSGCATTNDFSNAVYYSIEHPLEPVTSAFARFFHDQKWAFTEATTEWVGSEIKIPEVSYDVYRIVPNETPIFERLQIALRDESTVRGRDHIDVRLVLTYIETKSNLKYFDSYTCELNNRWLWVHLTK